MCQRPPGCSPRGRRSRHVGRVPPRWELANRLNEDLSRISEARRISSRCGAPQILASDGATGDAHAKRLDLEGALQSVRPNPVTAQVDSKQRVPGRLATTAVRLIACGIGRICTHIVQAAAWSKRLASQGMVTTDLRSLNTEMQAIT